VLSTGFDERRRRFIQKMGLTVGASFLTPILDGLIQEAWGQTSSKKRYIGYWMGNGIAPGHISATVRSQRDFDLPMSLSGLQPVKDKINVIRHLKNSSHSFLHGTSYSSSTCSRVGGEWGPPRGPSMNYLMSQALGKDTPRSLLVIGGGSYTSSGTAAAGSMSPENAYDTLFQGQVPSSSAGGVSPAELERRKKLKLSLLDFMVDDIKKAEASLAGDERGKLGQYIGSVEELKRQMSQETMTPAGKCAKPEAASSGDACKYVSDSCRIGVTAMACGMTRFLTVGSGNDGNNKWLKFSSIGVTAGLHSLYHGAAGGSPCGSVCNPSAATGMVLKLLKFHSEQVASMYTFLKQFPEGNGTMADNSLITWQSEGENHHGAGNRMCSIWVGNAGGAIKTTGNYITYPAGEKFLPQMWLTVAHAMGHNISKFGDGSTPCPGPLPNLLA
jgi:hypothetical protein